MPPEYKPRVYQILHGACVLLLIWMAALETVLADPEMKINIPDVYKNHPTPTPTLPPGRLVISEVMVDAAVEPQGEWIELYNAGGLTISALNYKIGDAEERLDNDEGMFAFPFDDPLEPGQTLVVAYQAAAFYSTFGVNPDYELYDSDPDIPNMIKYTAWASGSMILNNAGDEVILLNSADQWADAVSWGSSNIAFDPPVPIASEGHSLARYPADQDTNSASDWIEQSQPDPGSVQPIPPKTATPTQTPTEEPTDSVTPVHTSTATSTISPPPILLISEVLYNPVGPDDPIGEWVEIYNAGVYPALLEGYGIGDEEQSGGSEAMLRFPPGLTIPAGDTLVIAYQGSDFILEYGFSPDAEIISSLSGVPDMIHDPNWASGSFGLNDTGDEVLIIGTTDELIDALSWGSSAEFMNPPVPGVAEGHSLERVPADLDSDTANDWHDQPTPEPGQVQLQTATQTPTAIPTVTFTPTPSAPPLLIINEIHADPHDLYGDANQDDVVSPSQDEFVEIINISGHPVNLSGWQLRDNNSVRHIFPVDSILADQCAAVIFGGGNLVGNYGNSMAQIATSGLLSLNNSGDRVILTSPDGLIFVEQEYGLEAAYDQSVVRNPDISGPAPLVQHSSIPEAGGRLYSAGIRLNGTPFEGCNLSSQGDPGLLYEIYQGVCRLLGLCQ